MVFSSLTFLCVFLPLTLGVYYLCPRRGRNTVLLIASLVFYAWGEPKYAALMILSILANYGFGLLIAGCRGKRLWLIGSVVFNLGMLGLFKYADLLLRTWNALTGSGIDLLGLALPIGISFYTFQAMSYTIDVYRGKVAAQKNVLNFGAYIAMFPQLIAGPIVRYSDVELQLRTRRTSAEEFAGGLCRFAVGLAKKVLLANQLGALWELASRGMPSALMAWLGALAYTLQIYFDFSGYSDMAIGLGKMFGFRFEENFDYPYISRSVSEFWKHWHISLGRWFRDYIYFPLGGSRVGKAKLLRNLFAVWLFTGIWHGAAWQFIVWGLGYGVLISLEKLTGFPAKLRSRPARLGCALLTFLIVNAGWVLFGAQSLDAALYQLGAMLGIGVRGSADLARFLFSESWVFLVSGALLATPLIPRALRKLTAGREERPLIAVGQAALYMLLLVLSVSYLAMGSHNPFIYFTF